MADTTSLTPPFCPQKGCESYSPVQKGPEKVNKQHLIDVCGDFLRPPNGTTTEVVISDKGILLKYSIQGLKTADFVLLNQS